MSILKFTIDSATACKGGEADYYGQVHWQPARRSIVTTQPVWLESQLLMRGHNASLQKVARELLRAEKIKPDQTAAISLIRHCRRHNGQPLFESLATLVLRHANSVVYDVDPIIAPAVDMFNLTTLTVQGAPHAVLEPVFIPPIADIVADEYPITQVCNMPPVGFMGGQAYTALRGSPTEKIVEVSVLGWQS